MKIARFIIPLIIFTGILCGCSDLSDDESKSSQSMDSSQDISTDISADNSQNTEKDQLTTFVDDFSKNNPGYVLLDYVYGEEENSPIKLVAIMKNVKTEYSSYLLIVDEHGIGEVGLASGLYATYRKDDGLHLDKNIISVSLDVKDEDSISNIHDYKITVTMQPDQDRGKMKPEYSVQESIRDSLS